MSVLDIGRDDPTRPEVIELIRDHLAFANTHSPREEVHALDLDALTADGIAFFTAREADRLVGMGAIRELDPTHGELKSMHTLQSAHGRGVGRAIVEHLLEVAKDRGYTRVSLETGTMDAFAPSRALYRSVGFEECPPFAEYTVSPNSVCMTVEI